MKKSGAQATTEVPRTATETPPRQAVMEATLNGIKGPARLVHAAAADTQAGPPAPAKQAVEAAGQASTWQVVDMRMTNARTVNFFDSIFFSSLRTDTCKQYNQVLHMWKTTHKLQQQKMFSFAKNSNIVTESRF